MTAPQGYPASRDEAAWELVEFYRRHVVPGHHHRFWGQQHPSAPDPQTLRPHLCPLDGAPLAAMEQGLNGYRWFAHAMTGREHGDAARYLRAATLTS